MFNNFMRISSKTLRSLFVKCLSASTKTNETLLEASFNRFLACAFVNLAT